MTTMKLGTDTGSAINHLYSRMTKDAPEPVEGMDATVLSWTDRYAGKIVRTWQTRSKKFVGVDTSYGYFVFRHDGKGKTGWRQVQMSDNGTFRWVLAGSRGVIFGISDEYIDPHF